MNQKALHRLAVAGEIDNERYEEYVTVFGWRADKEEWRSFVDLLLLWFGGLLLASGVIFFFAYNWDDMHRFTKFAMVYGLFAAASVTALLSKSGSMLFEASGFVALTLVGASLALLGQIYQSGADAWNLFALWALFGVGFIAVSRCGVHWLLWSVVANTALYLYMNQVSAMNEKGDIIALIVLGVAMLGGLSLLLKRREMSRLRWFYDLYKVWFILLYTFLLLLYTTEVEMPGLLFFAGFIGLFTFYLRSSNNVVISVAVFAEVIASTLFAVMITPGDDSKVYLGVLTLLISAFVSFNYLVKRIKHAAHS